MRGGHAQRDSVFTHRTAHPVRERPAEGRVDPVTVTTHANRLSSYMWSCACLSVCANRSACQVQSSSGSSGRRRFPRLDARHSERPPLHVSKAFAALPPAARPPGSGREARSRIERKGFLPVRPTQRILDALVGVPPGDEAGGGVVCEEPLRRATNPCCRGR